MAPMLTRIAMAISGDHPTAWRLRPKDKADLRALVRANVVMPNTPTQADYLDDARAALEAMLEPDEGMIDAGECGPFDGEVDYDGPSATQVWQAMICAALEEKQ